MNEEHIFSLLDHFNLGQIKQQPKRVYGGLLHKMWRLEIDQGTYAVKQLSQDINLLNVSIITNYELSEQIATRFAKQGINAISAFNKSGKHLFIKNNTGYLVYPWVEATSLDKGIVDENYAAKIATILARMHRINLKVKLLEHRLETHLNDKIITIVNKANKAHCKFADELNAKLSKILDANKKYQASIECLRKKVIVSHGDLDQKNVLWDADLKPIIIDWESARKINSTYDIITVALDWSGIATNFNKDIFLKMINIYKEAGFTLDSQTFTASLYGVLGNQINWLVYNLNRAYESNNSEDQSMGTEQVLQTISTIDRLQSLIPEVIQSRELLFSIGRLFFNLNNEVSNVNMH